MPKTQSDLQVLSLNMYHGQLRDKLLAYVMGKMYDVSVFCFQETANETRPLIDDILLDNFVGYHSEKPVKNDPYNAAVSLYVRRDIEVLNMLTICSEVEGVGVAKRGELVDSQGRQFAITSVYGHPRPNDKLDTPERMRFSKEILSLTKSPLHAEIVVGDFNLMPETESVKMFADNGFRNLIEEFKVPTTRNEIAWQKYPPHMKQLYADFAFVRGEGIDCQLTVENVSVSDHLPLVVDLFHTKGRQQVMHEVAAGLYVN